MNGCREHRPRIASADSTLEPPRKKKTTKRKHIKRRHERSAFDSLVNEPKRLSQEVKSHSNASLRPQPLVHYVHNRAELLEQVFDILSDTDLKRILPNSLKATALDELKEMCLRHLKRVSEKQLLCIIADEPYESDDHCGGNTEDKEERTTVHTSQCETQTEPVVSSGICDLPPCPSVSMSNLKRQMSVNVGGEEDTIEIMVEDDSLEDGISEVIEEQCHDQGGNAGSMSPEEFEHRKQEGSDEMVLKTVDEDESISLTELKMREKALRSELKREEVVSVMDGQTSLAAHTACNQSETQVSKPAIISIGAKRVGSKKILLFEVQQKQKELLMLRQRALESMIVLCKNQKAGKATIRYSKHK